MKLHNRIAAVVAAVALCAGAFIASASADEVSLKIAGQHPIDHFGTEALNQIEADLEAANVGLSVKTFPAGQLGYGEQVFGDVAAGAIDIGPLDAYWHMLIAKYQPELTKGIRVLESTATAPMPAFVTAPSLPVETVERLRTAFAAAHERPWFAPFRQSLLIEGFAPMALRDYDVTLKWQRAATAADYPEPA